MTPAELATENEALHALLADACGVLDEIVEGDPLDVSLHIRNCAAECLERVRNGEAA